MLSVLNKKEATILITSFHFKILPKSKTPNLIILAYQMQLKNYCIEPLLVGWQFQ